MITTSILKSNNGECPLWSVEVSVFGWYRKENGSLWRFLRSECPIIENAQLPLHKQNPKYKLMFCKDRYSCPLYKEFQPEITKDI